MLRQAVLTLLIIAILSAGGCGRRAANMGTAPLGGNVAPPDSSEETSRQ